MGRIDRRGEISRRPLRTVGARPHVLFVHDAGAGQFGALGRWLARHGWTVTFASQRRDLRIEGCQTLTYGPHRAASSETHPYAQSFDRAVLNAQGFARAAFAARREGFQPDIVISHAGPGAGILARDIFPDARTIAYAEWWYNHPAPDLAYLGMSGATDPLRRAEQAMVERTRNAAMALEIASADLTICPTAFQARQFPPSLQQAIAIHHDGIDTELNAPGAVSASDATCPAALRNLRSETPLITYATRGMEPHRGFPHFMASLPEIMASRPDAMIAIAGENKVAYGNDSIRRVDWKARALADPRIDRDRVVFLGHLDPRSYRWFLRRSDAHVYLTAPFVLSWSMLEAMSLACPLILSDTEPVREFACKETSDLVDMRDAKALAAAILRMVEHRSDAQRRGEAARARILESAPAARLYREKAALLTQI